MSRPLNTDSLKLLTKETYPWSWRRRDLVDSRSSDPTEYPYKAWPPTDSWPPGLCRHTWQPPPARPQRHSISLSLCLFFWMLSLCIIALLYLENGSRTRLWNVGTYYTSRKDVISLKIRIFTSTAVRTRNLASPQSVSPLEHSGNYTYHLMYHTNSLVYPNNTVTTANS